MKRYILLLLLLTGYYCGYAQQKILSFTDTILIGEMPQTMYPFDTGDINGDGFIDIVCGSDGEDDLFWFKNLGNLTFSTPKRIADSLSYISCVAIADFDNDGDLDLVTTSYDLLRIFYNNGIAEFTTLDIYTSDVSSSCRISVADIDNDNDVDILLASRLDDYVKLFINNGIGFSVISIDSNISFPTIIKITDLDGDNLKDILVGSVIPNISDKVYWYKNLGGNTFSTKQLLISIWNDLFWVNADDISGDGFPDIITSSSNNPLSWYQNLGNGSFGSQQIMDTSNMYIGIHLADDVDYDGDLDIIAANHFDSVFVWFENVNSGGQFYPHNICSLPYGYGAYTLVSKMNNDTLNDIICGTSSTLCVINKLNSYQFNEPEVISTTNTVLQDCIVGDIDGDSDLDIAICYLADSCISILEQSGNNIFLEKRKLPITDFCNVFIFAEVNNDSFLDIIAYSIDDSSIVWYPNDGLGYFPIKNLISTNVGMPYELFSEDLNGDGFDDLLINLLGTTYWHPNDGYGNFGVANYLSIQVQDYRKLSTNDIDNDNDIDILIASWNDDKVAWYENFGNGTFSSEHFLNSQIDQPHGILAGDFDNDSLVDIISNGLNGFYFFKNNGNGIFSNGILVCSAIGSGINSFDIDNDQNLDLLFIALGYGIGALLNDGTAQFSAPIFVTEQAGKIVPFELDSNNHRSFISKHPKNLYLIIPKTSYLLEYHICQGDSVLISGLWYANSYSFTENLTNIQGFDSTITYIINVYPYPYLQLDEFPNDTVYENDDPVVLPNVDPTYAQISGNFVSGGYFYPSNAGPGTHWIYAQVSNFNPVICTSQDSTSIVVLAGNEISNHTQKVTNVYPNPSNGYIFLESDGLIEKIDIFSIEGKFVESLIFALSQRIIKSDLSHLKSGVYYLRVYYHQNIEIIKLTLIK
ncbi:MAG: T9SS type A sorting domain-containing protein [Bacteroidales bacterium]|nr:T9SS type A sorting domain-containing protein [Bacteroidales bacterium]MCF8455452.1 T9SS type A sorting domain-containing protein [Bacteroidales bacterium]